MTPQLQALCIEAHDPPGQARFWAGVLGRDVVDEVGLAPDDETGFVIRFLPGAQEKLGPNQLHPDLTSTSPEDQQATVSRALALGGRHLDIGQGDRATHVVMADPEGNEFDVLAPGNNFLAGCGFLGALAGDGTQAVGHFWSKALAWPLVWDQDEETAVQSPLGGTKITWGGPPVAPKWGRNRFHLDLVTPPGGDLLVERDRLLALGAALDAESRAASHEQDGVAMSDPGGNEFCLLPPA